MVETIRYEDGTEIKESFLHPGKWIACDRYGAPFENQTRTKVVYFDSKEDAEKELSRRFMGPASKTRSATDKKAVYKIYEPGDTDS